VNKSADTPVLVEAVRTVAQGRKYISPAIAGLLVQRLVTPQSSLPHERLSEREQQTLVMIASGRKLSEIAEELGLSPKTVSVYRARLLEKMKLSSNAELTHYAVKHGLVD
jgi:DNA-binding NarL/FixJ family response regulator